ncbi:hypothetical protein Nepgr_016455 [Nepenthes gracilis]|uniref:Uncharacterized protein n=1 Tax=Nepenthes gracilis TaxID=150966 RepID=A0AAD3SPR7_NEPGR|nr:hypothetical protein Nepgr_016455 [Nepenthes gracilis]
MGLMRCGVAVGMWLLADSEVEELLRLLSRASSVVFDLDSELHLIKAAFAVCLLHESSESLILHCFVDGAAGDAGGEADFMRFPMTAAVELGCRKLLLLVLALCYDVLEQFWCCRIGGFHANAVCCCCHEP